MTTRHNYVREFSIRFIYDEVLWIRSALPIRLYVNRYVRADGGCVCVCVVTLCETAYSLSHLERMQLWRQHTNSSTRHKHDGKGRTLCTRVRVRILVDVRISNAVRWLYARFWISLWTPLYFRLTLKKESRYSPAQHALRSDRVCVGVPHTRTTQPLHLLLSLHQWTENSQTHTHTGTASAKARSAHDAKIYGVNKLLIHNTICTLCTKQNNTTMERKRRCQMPNRDFSFDSILFSMFLYKRNFLVCPKTGSALTTVCPSECTWLLAAQLPTNKW